MSLRFPSFTQNLTGQLCFEAQNRKKEELRIQNERHEMKKNHGWDIRPKDATVCHRARQNVANFNKVIVKIATPRSPMPTPNAMRRGAMRGES